MPTSQEQKDSGWVSVTEVLDTFIPKSLLSWYLKTGAKEAKRLSTVAMKIGSRVDELIQQDVTNGSYKLSSKDPIEVKNCMEAWESFKRDYSPNILSCQVDVKDERNKVVGHIDLIIGATVVDVKCASSIKDNYWLQVGKYSDMLANDVDGVAILRLDKNLGTYQYVCNNSHKYYAQVFDNLLGVYRFYNQPKAEQEVV